MTPLPRIMVAPNGARRGKADHPALPITDAEIIETAIACAQAGADGIHLHIRDTDGRHEIDAAHYRAVLEQLRDAVPGMYLQVTSESAGRYSGDEQRAMMRALRPAHVSVALREMVRTAGDWPAAQEFYAWALGEGVEIQHILYSPEEVRGFVQAVETARIPGDGHLVQLVQGSYANGSRDSVDLSAYLSELRQIRGAAIDWMLCAFGADETASLVKAAELGGKARVGFENSLTNRDGTLATDNATRVREVDAALRSLNL